MAINCPVRTSAIRATVKAAVRNPRARLLRRRLSYSSSTNKLFGMTCSTQGQLIVFGPVRVGQLGHPTLEAAADYCLLRPVLEGLICDKPFGVGQPGTTGTTLPLQGVY